MKTASEHNQERQFSGTNERTGYLFPEHNQSMTKFRLAHQTAKVDGHDKAPWLRLPLLPEVTTVKYGAN